MRTTITISKIDTGFLIVSEDSMHAITSKDAMIAKVRELLDITRRPTHRTENKDISYKAAITTHDKEKPENGLKLTPSVQFKGIQHINSTYYLVPDAVQIPNNKNVTYFETQDGRLRIQYKSGIIHTTFDEINKLLDVSTKDHELEHVPNTFSSNQRTCIRQFMIAIRGGLKPGDSIDLDPDKDFRPILNRKSTIEHERGTLEELITS